MEGPVKLKDGLFFGDQAAAHDIEFVIANKVTRIINCAGRQVANHFESIGVEYLRFDWMDNDACTILDSRDETVEMARSFINESLDKGESVLVHSQRGQSRCIALLGAYLMRQFRWTVNKALQYIQSRRADVAIKPAFHRQLLSFERRLAQTIVLSDDWSLARIRPVPLGGLSKDYDPNEDIVMCNTYLNSQADKAPFSLPTRLPEQHRRRLAWTDNHLDDRTRLERDSDASGSVHLRSTDLHLKSILKKRIPESTRTLTKPQMSPISTAASTPQAAQVTPLVSSMRSPLVATALGNSLRTPVVANVPPPLRLGLRSITPSRQPEIRPPSPLVRPGLSLRPASPFTRPAEQARLSENVRPMEHVRPVEQVRPPSPLARIYANVGSDPGKIEEARGRSLNNAFSVKQSNHYIRPPSPMVRSVLQAPQGIAVRRQAPVGGVSAIRPPSPARPERAQPILRPMGVSGLPATRPLMTGSFRRAPSPMTAALQGPLRPQSAPQWRS